MYEEFFPRYSEVRQIFVVRERERKKEEERERERKKEERGGRE
jgi:hypothetical protein